MKQYQATTIRRAPAVTPFVATQPVSSTLVALPQAWSAASPLGFACLIVFLFLIFSRICDFFLPRLHLPFIFSSFSLIAAFFSGAVMMTATHKIGKYLLLFSGWLLLTVPFSSWRGGSYYVVVNEWSKSLATFFVVATLTVTLSQSIKVIRTIAYAMTVAAVLAVLFGVRLAGRLAHPVGEYGPNELASAMMLGLLYTWFIVSSPGHSMIRRLLGVLTVAPMLWVMVQTGSRGCLLTLVIVGAFLLKYYTPAQRLILVLALFGAVGAFFSTVRADVRHRYFTFLSNAAEKVANEEDIAQRAMTVGSSTTRLYMLRVSLMFTITHPLFGVGPGQFEVAENTYAHRQGKTKGIWLGTHNTYTQISSEAGIPGLIFFLACMFACRKELVTVEKLCKGFPQTEKIREITTVGFTLRMVWLAYTIFFFVEHIGYTAFFPALAGMILAFGRAARFELAQMQNAQRASAAVPVAV